MTAAALLAALLLAASAAGSGEAAEDSGDGGGREESGGEEGSFLDPYYEEAEEDSCPGSSGCWDDGCALFLDLMRPLAMMPVRYEPDPFSRGGARAMLGDAGEGNALALDIGSGLSGMGGRLGWSAGMLLRSPSPLCIDALFQSVSPDGGEPSFRLLYSGVRLQVLFDSPLSVMPGIHALVPWEEGRRALAGGGTGLRAELLLPGRWGLSGDYRLSWVSGLPLHRGEARLSRHLGPVAAWAGYGFLRGAGGRLLHGPSAGLGLSL